MRKETIGFVLCGLAGLAMAVSAAPRDAGSQVDFDADVSAVRIVPAGDPLPGIHIDVKVKGRMTDVYLAPTNFATKYGVKVAKGDEVQIVGTQLKEGDADVVLARSITTGVIDRRSGFHPTLTVYLRNDDGPFWVDNTDSIPAH